MQTLQQLRARHAMEATERLLEENDHKSLVAHASALPAMIHMNGLGQAAAFYRMKDGVHGKLYDALGDWLCSEQGPYANPQYHDLLQAITRSDMHLYRLAQAEAQEYLSWLKKFVKAFAVTGDTTDNTDAPGEENS